MPPKQASIFSFFGGNGNSNSSATKSKPTPATPSSSSSSASFSSSPPSSSSFSYPSVGSQLMSPSSPPILSSLTPPSNSSSTSSSSSSSSSRLPLHSSLSSSAAHRSSEVKSQITSFSPSFVKKENTKNKNVFMEFDNDDDQDHHENGGKPESKFITPTTKRTKRRIGEEDDEDDEYVPPVKGEEKESDDADEHDDGEDDEEEDNNNNGDAEDDDDDYGGKKGSGSGKGSGSNSKRPASHSAVNKSFSSPSSSHKPSSSSSSAGNSFTGDSSKYDSSWYDDDNLMDESKRRPSNPNYDPTTLYIPHSWYNDRSPGEKQFWDIKRKNADTILLYKVGKFYEMFDMDAHVGVRDLGLTYMPTQARPHAGFPEASIEKYSSRLAQLGRKFGRVEQTQTAKQFDEVNEERKKRGIKKIAVVERELLEVTTRGVICNSDYLVENETRKLADANYCFAIVERRMTQEAINKQLQHEITTESATKREREGDMSGDHMVTNDQLGLGSTASQTIRSTFPPKSKSSPLSVPMVVEYGIVYADVSQSKFFIGQIYDDAQRSNLRTLLGQVSPQEIVCNSDQISEETLSVIERDLPHIKQYDALRRIPPEHSLDASDTFEKLDKEEFFVATSESQLKGMDRDPDTNWPIGLKLLANEMKELSFVALGCLMYHLEVVKAIHHVKMGNFSLIEQPNRRDPSFLMLDGQTLQNLEIQRTTTGKIEGSLFSYVNRCVSPFGVRLMREWCAKPLYKISEINERLDAVEFFLENQSGETRRIRETLKGLPDLERILSRIYTYGLKSQQKAVMYGDIDAKKLKIFCECMKGLSSLIEMQKSFNEFVVNNGNNNNPDGEGESDHNEDICWQRVPLKVMKLLKLGLVWPRDAESSLQKFYNSFDFHNAQNRSFVDPSPGTHSLYEESVQRVRDAEKSLNDYLLSMKRKYSGEVCWFHRAKEVYQLEVPKRFSVPSDWTFTSKTAKSQRYTNREISMLANELEVANIAKEEILKDFTRLIFARFAALYSTWKTLIGIASELDCIIALANISSAQNPSCRPQFVDPMDNGGQTMMEIRGGIHPMIANTMPTYIPNDVIMGTDAGRRGEGEGEMNPNNEEEKSSSSSSVSPSSSSSSLSRSKNFIFVSGVNLGGKSSILRQTCVLTILAQMGCYVPAQSCRLSPVDRIFTRVGASDKIMQDQSTFLVELNETSLIINNATQRSLVILDELGRGTSTFDGTSIAFAVALHLSRRIGCLCLFATHYHMLLDKFKHDKRVGFYCMTSKVEGDRLVFLYKFKEGIAPRSHGTNVALLAGIPLSIAKAAEKTSAKFHQRLEDSAKELEQIEEMFTIQPETIQQEENWKVMAKFVWELQMVASGKMRKENTELDQLFKQLQGLGKKETKE